MGTGLIAILTALATVAVSHASAAGQAPLQVVPNVDYEHYLGTWYEIARLPNDFQKDCASDVTARYRTLLQEAKSQGFDVSKVVETRHTIR